MISIEIYTGKMSLSIFEPSNNEVVIVWVLIITFLIRDTLEIVGIVTYRVGNSIIEEEVLMTHFSKLAYCFLEISIFSSSSDQYSVRDLLIAINIIIL